MDDVPTPLRPDGGLRIKSAGRVVAAGARFTFDVEAAAGPAAGGGGSGSEMSTPVGGSEVSTPASSAVSVSAVPAAGPAGVATLLRTALEDVARLTDGTRVLQAKCADLEDRAAFLDSELRRAAADVQKLRGSLKDERRKNEKLFATLDLEREANLQAQAVIADLQARVGPVAGGGVGGGGGGGGGAGGGGGGGIASARDPSASFGPRGGGAAEGRSRMSFAAALATPGKGDRGGNY